MNKFSLFTFFLIAFLGSVCGQDPFVNFENQVALGSEFTDAAVKTAIDSDGNRIVYGTFSEELDFDPSASEFVLDPLGSPDLFLASYSADGELNWAFKLGRIALSDGMVARDMAVDSNGNILISGGFTLSVDFDPSAASTPLTAVQGLDGFVAQYDNTGQFVWVKQFGSTGFDSVSALAVDTDDNTVLGVRFGGEIDLDPSVENTDLVSPVGGIDAAVVKLDAAGDYQWSYSVAPGVNNEIVTALAVNSVGQIALGATVNGLTVGIPVQSMLAGYLDTDGTEFWSYDFQNQGQSNTISQIAFSEDEAHIYLGGRIQEITDFDPSAGEVIISPLFADPFLSKHSAADGSLAWATYIESNSTADYCAGVTEEGGVVYMAGSFDVLALFVPGDFASQVETNGAADLFVAVYNATTGEFLEAETFGGLGSERAYDAHFAGSEGLVIVGHFISSLSLSSGVEAVSQGFEDGFVANFSYLYILSAENGLSEKEVNVFPVPASDQVYVQLKESYGQTANIKLISIIGQTVFEGEYILGSSKHSIDISGFPQGIYLLEITVGNTSVTKRVVKQ